MSTRDRIVAATAALLSEGGREAVSTRAVSAAAGVQAPAIYRLFGDKQGLLDAVAGYGFASYLRSKTALEPTDDPVADLRRGWDLHVDFGLRHPAFYTLIYGEPRPGVASPAARDAAAVLAGQVRRIARAGRLRMAEDRAAHLIHAAGSGTTLALIAIPPERRDMELSVIARESIIAAVTTDGPGGPAGGGPAGGGSAGGGSAGGGPAGGGPAGGGPAGGGPAGGGPAGGGPAGDRPASAGPVPHAVALRTALPETTVLSGPEKALLGEWLDRIAAAG